MRSPNIERLELRFRIVYQLILNIPSVMFMALGVAVIQRNGIEDVGAVLMAMVFMSLPAFQIYAYGPAFLSRARAFVIDRRGIHRLRWPLRWETTSWDTVISISEMSLPSQYVGRHFQINTEQGVPFRIPAGAWAVNEQVIEKFLHTMHRKYQRPP